MNRDLTIRQWKLHQHHSAKFTRPNPRTSREAFGCEFEGEARHEDAWVFAAAVAGLLIGMVVVWL